MDLHFVAATGQDSSRQKKTLTILLHGGALSSSMYCMLTPHLKMPSIAVDLPGHGKSASLGPFTFKKSTELLKSLIDALQQDEKYSGSDIVLVGQSLGGQAVLDFVCNHSGMIATAIISGAPIHAPDSVAAWEMPHMPTDQMWIDLMTKDIGVMGMKNAQALQQESFAFQLGDDQHSMQHFPPMLICIGESDVAMAKRDFDELVNWARRANQKSSGLVIKNAWHNHSIDIPEEFAMIVNNWAEAHVSAGL